MSTPDADVPAPPVEPLVQVADDQAVDVGGGDLARRVRGVPHELDLDGDLDED